MLKKLINLVTGERGRTKRLVATLDDFLENAKSNSLTDEQAQKNLEEGVVELVKNGQHSSNGLLITDDGYFLTARHCVEHSLPQYVRLYDGSVYPFENVCSQREGTYLDLALAKVKILGECKSRKYKICDKGNLKPGSSLRSLSRWNGELIHRDGSMEGKVIRTLIRDATYSSISKDYASSVYANSILSSVPTIKGDSGGILITPDAGIIGILCRIYSTEIYLTDAWQKNQCSFQYSEAITISEALELIDSYKHKLESKL